MRLSGAVSLKVCFGLGLASLMTSFGCGGGGSVTLPHPTGSYSNASLKGQYVYQVHGISPSTIYRELGVFVADGAGNITSTSDDSSTNAGAVSCTSACGTYQINSDGTGFITLNSTALSSSFSPVLGPLTLALTLVSASKVDLIEADAFADAAGAAELQDSTATGAIPSGTFAFRLHQVFGTSLGTEAGVVTISAGGTVSNGSMDQNFNGNTSQLTLSGTLTAPASLGRGTGTFTDSGGSTTNFTYYIVNAGKIDILASSTNGNRAIGLGSAEIQSGSVGSGFSGTYVFGSRGDDLSTSGFFDGVATVGQFTGSGATISSGVYDSMLDGNYSASVSFTGTPTTSSNNPSSQGRVQMILSTGAVEDFWMVSPTRAFFITESSSEIEDGTADLQTTTSFSASTMKGQFALVMDGGDFTQLQIGAGTLARVGTLQFDGTGNLTLSELVNASNSGSGAQSPGVLSGRYQVSSNGRIVSSLNSSTLNVVMYAVSSSDAYVLQTDLGTNTSGTVSLQH